MLRKIGKIVKAMLIGLAVITAVVIVAIFESEEGEQFSAAPVAPDWAAIAAWPGIDAADVEARPDPGRTFTAIILDDSGSMGSDIVPARDAVVAALDAMDPDDRVAVIALNAGEILPFSTVSDAKGTLPALLARVISEGGTPLTGAMIAAREALAREAAVAGGFGTYRILVTTDGAADDSVALQAEVEHIARATPIQIATIGVGIRGGHILRRDDLAAFVAIDDVGQLAAALRDAIAEEQTFSAITSFGGG
jgi:hypothetical protein